MEDLGDISRGDLMAQQILRPTQIVVHLLTHGELQREALGREGRNSWRILRCPRLSRLVNLPRGRFAFLSEGLAPRWNGPHVRGHIGLRKTLCDQQLDLRLAPMHGCFRSSPAFSAVKCGASRQTALKCNRPSATRVKISGKRRAVRAAWMRLCEQSSEKCSSPTQYANIEEYPAGAYRRRSSTWAMSASFGRRLGLQGHASAQVAKQGSVTEMRTRICVHENSDRGGCRGDLCITSVFDVQRTAWRHEPRSGANFASRRQFEPLRTDPARCGAAPARKPHAPAARPKNLVNRILSRCADLSCFDQPRAGAEATNTGPPPLRSGCHAGLRAPARRT